MDCGYHTCERLCHSDTCGQCMATCGKLRKSWYALMFYSENINVVLTWYNEAYLTTTHVLVHVTHLKVARIPIPASRLLH